MLKQTLTQRQTWKRLTPTVHKGSDAKTCKDRPKGTAAACV